MPVGLRYILVAVLKLKGGSPASIYASASTVSAYPMQSYDIMFISVTNHQLKKTDVQISALLALPTYSLPTLR